MTEKLYYKDAYRKEFTATIREVKQTEGRLLIRLDRTAFYPEGGGQNADTGRLFLLNEKGEPGQNCCESTNRKNDAPMPSAEVVFNIVDVQEIEGEIWHTAEGAYGDACSNAIAEGLQVRGQIAWERRFDHMQQHSGEHIVSGMICSRFHCDNVGFHMGEDAVLIDINVPITYEEALEIEAAANRYIWEDHALVVQWPSAEELSLLSYRSKKELEGDVRIVSFPGADTCACCGTHVSASAQIGLVKFLSAKPFHEGTRLELLCGKRAMDYLVSNHRENKEIGVLLSAKETQTADRVKKLMEENSRLKLTTAALEDKIFPFWADRFLDKGDSFVLDDQLSAAQGRRLADLIADRCGGVAAVFTKLDTGYAYAIISRNTEVKELVSAINETLHGRGGGRNGFAQGSVATEKREIQNFFGSFWKAE